MTIRDAEFESAVLFSRKVRFPELAIQSFPGVLNAKARLQLAVALALPFVLFTTPAGAVGLGPAQVRSSLGEPLHLQIPVNAASPDEVGCVQISDAGDLPAPSRARAQVLTLPSGGIVIDVTTSLPTSEPALGFSLSAGCQSAISRTYTLFLDPPANAPDLASVGSLVTPGLSTTPIDSGSRRRRRGGASGAGTGLGAAPSDVTAPALPRRTRLTPAVPANPAKGVKRDTPLAPVQGAEVAPNRLHLSSDIGTDLRLADELGQPDAIPIDATQLQQLKDERAKLAALLAGQDPSKVPSAKEVDLQNRINSMSSEINSLHQQLAVQAERQKELEDSRSNGYLTWVFAAVALLAALVASWFGFRYRRAQTENLDQPWWEQSQMANVTERGGGETPFAVRADGVPANTIVEPEVLDHDTFIQTTRFSKPSGTAAPVTMPLHDNEPSTVARGPVTMPLAAPPAATPVVASQPAAPVVTASMVSPLAPVSAQPSQYGDAKSSSGSLDERIDSGMPKPLDFNLDLPPVTTNLGHDDRGVASSGSLQNDPIPRPTELAPLDFELPKAAMNDATGLGPDTILRLDAQDSGVELPLGSPESETEQASVQFRLIQFTSVVEQAEELEKNQEPTKAIAALRQYVLRDETIPTLMWLMLFGLYKQVNKRPVYDALGEHFSRRYKRPMARWDESLQSIAPQTPLASLPELDEAIRAKWGTQAGIEMLRALTCGRDQPNEIIFNAALQRDLLQMAKVFPLNDSL